MQLCVRIVGSVNCPHDGGGCVEAASLSRMVDSRSELLTDDSLNVAYRPGACDAARGVLAVAAPKGTMQSEVVSTQGLQSSRWRRASPS